jgi:serine/threonine-protein kinase SBK
MAMDSNGVYQTSLDERFTFLRQAGKGTYGTTWIAVDKETNEKVAIKAINKATTNRTSFKKELKYSKHLSKHSYIIKTHDTAFETKTCFVMVQDYAQGGDLFDAIEPEVGLHESKARIYFGQIAKALEFMHSKKLVHRDLKPENVVLGDVQGTHIKLIDFGMTLRTGTHVSRVCGSIPYTPPEICNASDDVGFFVEPSCDVWSAGVLLFCMLTGSFPWEQATLSDANFAEFVDWQNGRGKVPHMWRNFSPQLLELFSKLLALDANKRCKISEVHQYLSEPWYIVRSDVYPTTTTTYQNFSQSSHYQAHSYDVEQYLDAYTTSQCGISLISQFGASHYQPAVACS